MNWFRESFRAALLSLKLGLSRPRHQLLTMAGLFIASLTLMIVLTIPAGLSRIAAITGRDDVVVVLASPRGDETDGNITPERVERIGALPGVARDANGAPLMAPQFVVHSKFRRHDGMPVTAVVRGATSAVWQVIGDDVRILRGQRFESGVNELVSGVSAARRYLYAGADSDITLPRSIWHVSGEFGANGNLWESELWGDRDALQAVFNAQGQVTTIWVRLAGADGYSRFGEAMRADPQLRGLSFMKQRGFYASRVGFVVLFARVAAWTIAVLLGLQALLVSHNAIGLSLRARQRDLAILRSVGFRNSTLLTALLVETLLLSVLCAATAIAIGFLLLNGRGIDSSTLDSSIHFTAAMTPEVVLSTLAYAMLLGFFSAIVPAWSSLRAPLAPALASE